MMETSLICLLPSTTKSFKLPCRDMLTVLPTTCAKLPHPGCSQQEAQPSLQPPLEAGLGPHQPTHNPGGQKMAMTIPRQVGSYWQSTCREQVLRRTCQREKSEFGSSSERPAPWHLWKASAATDAPSVDKNWGCSGTAFLGGCVWHRDVPLWFVQRSCSL